MTELLGRVEADGAVRWVALNGRRVEEILPDPFGPFERSGLSWPLASVRLRAPVEPSKIVAVGVNDADHAKEFGKTPPREPLIFLKPPSAVIGPGDLIHLPRRSRRVDFEGEIAVVIGRRARSVSVRRAADHILGLTLMNDVTARDLQKEDGQWTRAKGFDTFAPLGPWIATGLDLGNVDLRTDVNGVRRQSSSTGRLIFDIPTLLSFVSGIMTLEPGDVLSTGTPSGVGPLKGGDRVVVRSSRIGRLENRVARS